MRLVATLIAALLVTAACDVAAPVAGSSPATTARASALPTVVASASATPAASPSATPTPAPATAAPTAPPPPPPTARPAPSITAVPPRAARGSTFVLQFKGFPTSANGLDVVQVVTLPNGVKLAPKTFTAKPDGTGFTTYLASLGDPTGQHVIELTGGGQSAFVIVLVD